MTIAQFIKTTLSAGDCFSVMCTRCPVFAECRLIENVWHIWYTLNACRRVDLIRKPNPGLTLALSILYCYKRHGEWRGERL